MTALNKTITICNRGEPIDKLIPEPLRSLFEARDQTELRVNDNFCYLYHVYTIVIFKDVDSYLIFPVGQYCRYACYEYGSGELVIAVDARGLEEYTVSQHND